jgi:hypothetical protein
MGNVGKMDMLANCEDLFRHARWSEQKDFSIIHECGILGHQ